MEVSGGQDPLFFDRRPLCLWEGTPMRQQLLQLLAVLPIPALLADQNLLTVGYNPAAAALLPGLAAGQSLQPFFSGADPADCAERLAAGQKVTLTLPLAAPTLLELLPLGSEGGEALGWLRPAAPENPANSADALSAFSHGFRQPLSEMFGMLSVVGNRLHDLQDDSCDDYLDRIFRCGYRMLRSFTNLTELYSYHNGTFAPLPESPVDLWALTRSLCRSADLLTEAEGVPITYDLPDAPCPVLCRQEQFATVLSNLFANSCSYTREGNAIHVSGRLTAGSAVITVTDRGLGIPDSVQPHICRPFFSWDPNGAPYAGMGLGLALARSFVSSCGGTLALQSRELEGTSVALSLPIYRGEKPILACYDPSELLTDRFSPLYVALAEVCRCPGV